MVEISPGWHELPVNELTRVHAATRVHDSRTAHA